MLATETGVSNWIQFIQWTNAEPNDVICNEENSKTVDFQQKFPTPKLKPKVPAPILIKESCANSQPKPSYIIPKVGLSACQFQMT